MAFSFVTPIVILIFTQLLFTVSDLIGRYYMVRQAFSVSTFISWWFLAYFIIRLFATFGQLYVFSKIELGKTMALFGAASIVLANVLGFLFLGEVLSIAEYAGVVVAIIAFLVLSFT